MAISNNYAPVKTIGDGVTVDFSYGWDLIIAEYIVVDLQEIATGNLTPQVLDSDFTLEFDELGGIVTFITPPTSLYNVVISRDTGKDQTNKYSTAKGFQGVTHEKSYDKVTAITQEICDTLTRIPQFKFGSDNSDVEIDDPEADKFLVWNETGDGITNSIYGDSDIPETTDDLTEGSVNLYDKTVVLNEGVGIDIISDYPTFKITATGVVENTDKRVQVSSTDVSAGYLEEKITSDDSSVNITKTNPASFEKLDLSVIASQVPYDNSDSTLESSNVKTALDELDISNLSKSSTGLVSGGNLTINVDPTKYDVAAGSAQFIDSHTDSTNPTATIISWTTKTAVTLTTLATQAITFISIDINGDLVESANSPVEDDRRDLVLFGVLAHESGAFIRVASSNPLWVQDSDLRELDFYTSIGAAVNKEGNNYEFSGSNLKIDKTLGKTFGPGYNYDNDLKNPNIVTNSAETEITFVLFQRLAAPTLTDTIPVTQYDPNGDGTLVDIPEGYFVSHRIFFDSATKSTIVQYAQSAYDSLKKASDSYDKETFEHIPEVENVNCRCVLMVGKDSTDLSDPLGAKFANLGAFGTQDFNVIPNYSRFAEPVELVDGLSYQVQDLTILEDTDVIYADVEADGGGDITYVFGQREYILDCTTGDGVGGKARIALAAGSVGVPENNYIYVIKSGDIAIIQSSTSRPTGEFAYIGEALLPDVPTFKTEGSWAAQEYTDAKEFDGRSAVQRSSERLRVSNAEYENGGAQTVTITTNVGTPDNVDFTNTAGQAWQKHLQGFPARQVSIDGAYVVNHPTTPYLKITDIADLLVDANNNSLSGRRFNITPWMAVSKSTGECKLYINLPNGSYGTNDGAIADSSNLGVTSIPSEFKGIGILLGRMPLRHQPTSGGTWTNLALTELGVQTIDLRGQTPGTFGGSSSVPSTSTFLDSAFRVVDNTDNTKEVALEVSGVTTATTRTLTVPDASGTIALTSNLQAGELRGAYKHAYDTAYKEFTFSAGEITNIDIWTNAGKTVKLFSKTFVFVSGKISTATTVDEITSATLTKTFVFTGEELTNITEVIT